MVNPTLTLGKIHEQHPPLINKDPYSINRYVAHYGKKRFVLHEKNLLDELNLY